MNATSTCLDLADHVEIDHEREIPPGPVNLSETHALMHDSRPWDHVHAPLRRDMWLVGTMDDGIVGSFVSRHAAYAFVERAFGIPDRRRRLSAGLYEIEIDRVEAIRTVVVGRAAEMHTEGFVVAHVGPVVREDL